MYVAQICFHSKTDIVLIPLLPLETLQKQPDASQLRMFMFTEGAWNEYDSYRDRKRMYENMLQEIHAATVKAFIPIPVTFHPKRMADKTLRFIAHSYKAAANLYNIARGRVINIDQLLYGYLCGQ